ncbi:TPA: hypothetical protein EYP66_08940 [Candidatus Poribacteria bacterium]|nr:hypothetical protein [Candidatus Poribacteria bacterium]
MEGWKKANGFRQVQPGAAIRTRITFRIYLIALPLIVVNSWWLMANWGTGGYLTGQSFPTIVSLYFNAICFLAVLLGINILLRRASLRLALNEKELLIIYVVLTVASAVAGHDTLQILWPMVTYSIWFATAENEWIAFHQYIPDWLTIKDKGKLTAFYQGESSFYTWEHISLWLSPVLRWSVFFIVLTLMMLFIVVLVRERWITHEKLSYPIIHIPLAMTAGGGSFFKSRLMWLGFFIAGGINLINGLHFLYPRVPSLGGSLYDIGGLFDTKPFSAIGHVPVGIFPFAVGMSFFIPVELSFSIWFFYLLGKMTRVFGSLLGLLQLPGFPYTAEQSTGAWLGLALVAVWMSRKYLFEQLKTARWTGKRKEDEPMSVRTAVIGLFLGGIFLIGFCWIARVPFWAILAYLTLFFAIAFAITRVRAEVGPPSHHVYTQPTAILVMFLGSRQIGPSGLTLFSFFRSFNRSYRSHPMPNLLEGFAISARRNIESDKLLWAIVMAVVVGTVSSAWAYYAHAYRFGGALYGEQNQCRWYFDELARWMTHPSELNSNGIAAALIGGGLTFTLMALRHRFLWWPFHPAGYAISLGEWNMNWYWFSIFVGWFLKMGILKFGGIQTHRRSLPFFIGLVFGEFTMGGIWTLLGIIRGQPMYRFMP